MRIIILTSSLYGFGAYCLPALARLKDVEMAMVVYSEGGKKSRWEFFKRKLNKARRIGILGAINGVRMRRWYKDDLSKHLGIQDLRLSAREYDVRLEVTPSINCERTKELFKEANADLGLSLGNPYIAESVFSLPTYGMVNVHHEWLPDYQGAQSVVWQIHNGSAETGYTIHEINDKIDKGRILYQERLPIEFRRSLGETVTQSYARLYEASVDGLIAVLQDFEAIRKKARSQPQGDYYTTPTFAQYLRMVMNHRKLARQTG